MTLIDINCDMGEGFGAYTIGDDINLMEVVTSANVACGFHGGDPLVMYETMRLALAKGVGVGAHPSFLDLWGFGRRTILGEEPSAIMKAVIYQIGASRAIAQSAGHRLGHIKLHGALANQAFGSSTISDAVAQAIVRVDPSLMLVVMPGSCLEKAGENAGLTLVREIYADRHYDDDGNLLSRKRAEALITEPDFAVDRVLSIIGSGQIRTQTGRIILLERVDSVCIHGDTPSAVKLARRLRLGLAEAGFILNPMRQP